MKIKNSLHEDSCQGCSDNPLVIVPPVFTHLVAAILPNLVLQSSTRLLLPAVYPPFVAAVVIFLTLCCSVLHVCCCLQCIHPSLLLW